MADEIDPNAEAKPINTNATVGAFKEYDDGQGGKVIVTEAELNPEALKTYGIQKVEALDKLVELKAKPACVNCRFWNPTEMRQTKDGRFFPVNGECRVNAPEMTCRTIISSASDYSSSSWSTQESGTFPLIGPYQWCGKYEAIPV